MAATIIAATSFCMHHRSHSNENPTRERGTKYCGLSLTYVSGFHSDNNDLRRVMQISSERGTKYCGLSLTYVSGFHADNNDLRRVMQISGERGTKYCGLSLTSVSAAADLQRLSTGTSEMPRTRLVIDV